MNKTQVIEFITQKEIVSIPLVQFECNLSYSQAKAIIDELVCKEKLKFIGGINYQNVAMLPEFEITANMQKRIDCLKSNLMENFSFFLGKIDPNPFKMFHINDFYEHNKDKNGKSKNSSSSWDNFNEFFTLEIKSPQKTDGIDNNKKDEETISGNERFQSKKDYENEILADRLAYQIILTCRNKPIDAWAVNYCIYLLYSSKTEGVNYKNIYNTFWKNLYEYALDVKKELERIITRKKEISLREFMRKTSASLCADHVVHDQKTMLIIKQMVYDVKRMSEDKFFRFKYHLFET